LKNKIEAQPAGGIKKWLLPISAEAIFVFTQINFV